MAVRWMFLGYNSTSGEWELHYSDDLSTTTRVSGDFGSAGASSYANLDLSPSGQFVTAETSPIKSFQLTRRLASGPSPNYDEIMVLTPSGGTLHSNYQKPQPVTTKSYKKLYNARDLNGNLFIADYENYALFFIPYGITTYSLGSQYRAPRWKNVDAFSRYLKLGIFNSGIFQAGVISFSTLITSFWGGETWRFKTLDYVHAPAMPSPPSTFRGGNIQIDAINWLTPTGIREVSRVRSIGDTDIFFSDTGGDESVGPGTYFDTGMFVIFNGDDSEVYEITDIQAFPDEITPTYWWFVLDRGLATTLSATDTIEQVIPAYRGEMEIFAITEATLFENLLVTDATGFSKGDSVLTIEGDTTGLAASERIGFIPYDDLSYQGAPLGTPDTHIFTDPAGVQWRLGITYLNPTSGECVANLEFYSAVYGWSTVTLDTTFNAGDTLDYTGSLDPLFPGLHLQIKYFKYRSDLVKGAFLWDSGIDALDAVYDYACEIGSITATINLNESLPIDYSQPALMVFRADTEEWTAKEWKSARIHTAGEQVIELARDVFAVNESTITAADVMAFSADSRFNPSSYVADTDLAKRQYALDSISGNELNIETALLDSIITDESILVGVESVTSRIYDNSPVLIETGDDGELYTYEDGDQQLKRYSQNGLPNEPGYYLDADWQISKTGVGTATSLFSFKGRLVFAADGAVWSYETDTGTLIRSFGSIGHHAQVDESVTPLLSVYNDGSAQVRKYDLDTGVLSASYLTGSFSSLSNISMVLVMDAPPEITSISVNGGDPYTTSSTVTIATTPAAWGPLIQEMRIRVDSGATEGTWTDWLTYSASKSHTLPAPDGEKTVICQYRNVFGTGPDLPEDSIILDTEAPQNPSVSINGGAAKTSTIFVTLTLNAENPISLPMEMAIANSEAELAVATWEPYATSKSWSLYAGADGLRSVFAKFRDAAGNTTGNVGDNIILDTTPPQNVSIVINGGASTTAIRDVTLTISADDDPYEMRVSEDETFSGVAWEPYSSEKAFQLSDGFGAKVVYLSMRDDIGNIADTVSDSIIYSEEDLVEVGTIIGDVSLTLKSVFSSGQTVIKPPVLVVNASFLNNNAVTPGLMLGKLYLVNESDQEADKEVYLASGDNHRAIISGDVAQEEPSGSGNYRVSGTALLIPQQWTGEKTYTIYLKFEPLNNPGKTVYATVSFDIENQISVITEGTRVRVTGSNLQSNTDYSMTLNGIKNKSGDSTIEGLKLNVTTPTITGHNLL